MAATSEEPEGAVLWARVPKEMNDALAAEARRRMMSRSALIREIMARALEEIAKARVGQEVSMTPSEDYLEAARQVQAWIAMTLRQEDDDGE